jgi:hypothetical protein
VIETALADVQLKKAAWTAPDLTRAISDALPEHLGALNGRQITELLDGLTMEALGSAVALDAARPGEDVIPPELLLANGQSSFQAPGQQLYATAAHVRSERALLASTVQRTAPALASTSVDAFVTGLAEVGIELGVDQAAAVRGVLTSGANVESLVGPAGTGKSFVVGALAKAWQDPDLWAGQQRRVIGLASSQVASDVLAGEGVAARNIAQWLGVQHRIGQGRASEEDREWQLRSGDLVVVDESAMTNTADLAQIHRHVTAAGAKLLLTGDHRQLAGVGAAGGMELLAQAGASYELAEARRFSAGWERRASLRLRAGDATALKQYHKHGRLIDGGSTEDAEASATRAWLADTLRGEHSLLIVDSNEQAGRLSASIRAELVRLGKVSEDGVPLAAQGTYAGVGDLVQARRNGWHLAGYAGNRRGPINREQYRVVETRPDGSMVVARLLGRGPGGEQLGDRMTLPASYVAEHVALGYASTVHSAQGMTVDTCHTVVTAGTAASALYVGMSRGRHSNTAHVTTVTRPVDEADGSAEDVVRRSPEAVLAAALETAAPEQSATATAAESKRDNDNVRTPAELLAYASEIATADRTARWLDELVDEGHLSPQDRARLAAEDSGPALGRLLRRAELAGHDPRQVLADAVTERSLDGARQLTHVIHHRITGAVSLDPHGDRFADWTPRVEDPVWQRYLDTLAAAADARRIELGRQAAIESPQWAVEAFGPVPDEPDQRAEWIAKAAAVATHRELVGHDDPADALGPAPKPGQVEAYASWRAAWHALGRPEADRDEVEMSDGQLRLRIRAHEREEAWAPRYVANELAGTRQSIAQQRQQAALRQAEAADIEDPAQRAELEREAAEAAALAEVLEQRAAQLAEVDQARAQWLAHTAGTRAAKERAQAELTARHAEAGHEDVLVTAEEWLAEHRAAQQAEDPHREVTDEHELAEVAAARAQDVAAVDPVPHADAVETGVPDIREIAAGEPAPIKEDSVRVPSAEETAHSITAAQRALAEIAAREAEDAQRAAEDAYAEQITRWQADDPVTEDTAAAHVARDEPALDLAARHA